MAPPRPLVTRRRSSQRAWPARRLSTLPRRRRTPASAAPPWACTESPPARAAAGSARAAGRPRYLRTSGRVWTRRPRRSWAGRRRRAPPPRSRAPRAPPPRSGRRRNRSARRCPAASAASTSRPAAASSAPKRWNSQSEDLSARRRPSRRDRSNRPRPLRRARILVMRIRDRGSPGAAGGQRREGRDHRRRRHGRRQRDHARGDRRPRRRARVGAQDLRIRDLGSLAARASRKTSRGDVTVGDFPCTRAPGVVGLPWAAAATVGGVVDGPVNGRGRLGGFPRFLGAGGPRCRQRRRRGRARNRRRRARRRARRARQVVFGMRMRTSGRVWTRRPRRSWAGRRRRAPPPRSRAPRRFGRAGRGRASGVILGAGGAAAFCPRASRVSLGQQTRACACAPRALVPRVRRRRPSASGPARPPSSSEMSSAKAAASCAMPALGPSSTPCTARPARSA